MLDVIRHLRVVKWYFCFDLTFFNIWPFKILRRTRRGKKVSPVKSSAKSLVFGTTLFCRLITKIFQAVFQPLTLGDSVVIADSLGHRNAVVTQLDETHVTLAVCGPNDNPWESSTFSGFFPHV